MSSLSKITITKFEKTKFRLKIENIHPDAPSLEWYNLQCEKDIKANVLFRTLLIIEENKQLNKEPSSFFEKVYNKLIPKIEEEYGEAKPLTKFTEITEYGSDILFSIVDDIFTSVKIVEHDINDNWQKGLIVNFNPYKSDNCGIPYIVFEIELTENNNLDNYLENPIYSSTGITCKHK